MPVNRSPNKPATNVPNNKLKNQSFCSLASFSIALPTPFNNNPDFSREITIFRIPYIFSFETINVVVPEQSNFFWMVVSVADATAANPNGIKTSLANSVSAFFVKANLDFSNGPRSLPRNLHDCNILDSWFFDHFILSDKLFPKVLQSFETCLSVSNNLCEKVISYLDLPIIFDNNLKLTPVSFFIAYFDLWSCELENFTFKLLCWVISCWYSYWRKINF